MSAKSSAGILLYRFRKWEPEVLLVHPGGPFWAHKDEGVWSIPKGEIEKNEDLLQAARREFFEETGKNVSGNFKALAPVKQKSGKIVYAFVLEKNIDIGEIRSNTFDLEWPPHSGKIQKFPEADRADWFPISVARQKIVGGQVPLLEDLLRLITD